MKKKTFRLSDREDEILAQFCLENERSENDVTRELIRGLEKKLKSRQNDHN